MATVVYYYDERSVDLDNILKPILDALSGVVYVDDQQVTDIRAALRPLRTGLELERVSSVLAAGLESGQQFVHIRVSDAPDPSEVV